VVIPQDQPLNLLDAISRAGGFSRLADRKRVKLTRQTEDKRTNTVIINADDIIQSSGNSGQQRLQKGDVVYVPERIL
jgi:polysaccharide export outer membrane protein